MYFLLFVRFKDFNSKEFDRFLPKENLRIYRFNSLELLLKAAKTICKDFQDEKPFNGHFVVIIQTLTKQNYLKK